MVAKNMQASLGEIHRCSPLDGSLPYARACRVPSPNTYHVWTTGSSPAPCPSSPTRRLSLLPTKLRTRYLYHLRTRYLYHWSRTMLPTLPHIVEQVGKSGTDPVGKPWLYLKALCIDTHFFAESDSGELNN